MRVLDKRIFLDSVSMPLRGGFSLSLLFAVENLASDELEVMSLKEEATQRHEELRFQVFAENRRSFKKFTTANLYK